MTRGAGNHVAPLTYEGEYDPARVYLPRHVVTVTDGDVRTGYLATAKTIGVAPTDDPTVWLPLGGGGTAPSDVASITLLGVLDGTTRGIVEVTNAQFRDNGCTLIVEATCDAATIVTVNFAAPGSPETRVGGAVVGWGSVAKVRDAAGALVTPATWHIGNLTYDASIPDYKWVSPSADNADFTSAGGTAIQLVLGGTYLFYLAAWL